MGQVGRVFGKIVIQSLQTNTCTTSEVKRNLVSWKKSCGTQYTFLHVELQWEQQQTSGTETKGRDKK